MFKTWQIFVFSLIPLALVFAGVFIGSIHGSDSEREVFPTPAPAATPRSLVEPNMVGPLTYVSMSQVVDIRTPAANT